MAAIRGTVKTDAGKALSDVDVAFIDLDSGEVHNVRSADDGTFNTDLKAGRYTWVAFEEGYNLARDVLELNGGGDAELPVTLSAVAGNPSVVSVPEEEPGTSFSLGHLIDKLDDHPLETGISAEEARLAIGLFSVSTLVQGTTSDIEVGGQTYRDVLGVLHLKEGVRKGSLPPGISTSPESHWWKEHKGAVNALASHLQDDLQSYIATLQEDAYRYFNLGRGVVPSNTRFPTLFAEYVRLANDSRLAIDLGQQETSEIADKAKLQEAFDVLLRLRDTIVDIVQMLSAAGNAGMEETTDRWGGYIEDALKVLGPVAQGRDTGDMDDENTWKTVADLSGMSREQLLPFVAHSIHGASLLQEALEIHKDLGQEEKLETYNASDLLTIFQSGSAEEFRTATLRRHAAHVARHPIPDWSPL